jgi:hypothetical protein
MPEECTYCGKAIPIGQERDHGIMSGCGYEWLPCCSCACASGLASTSYTTEGASFHRNDPDDQWAAPDIQSPPLEVILDEAATSARDAQRMAEAREDEEGVATYRRMFDDLTAILATAKAMQNRPVQAESFPF